jgi:ribosomal protein S18 acetylase RimI-like enzyme
MPTTRNPDEIRAILNTDRRWAVYPLGDLAPGFFERCVWVRSAHEPPTLLLLYRGFEPPPLFALGDAGRVPELLDELAHDGEVDLQVRPEVLEVLRTRFDTGGATAMWRMTLEPADYRPAPTAGTVRLGVADHPALQRLYADGAARGESPNAFSPSMVAEGVFLGLYEGAEMVSVAGTHLVVAQEGVAAVGNIYTRRDRRGRGLGACVTSAVVNELLRMGLPTIALNVAQKNTTAARVYERLGFVRYCPFYEGHAAPRRAASRPPEGGPAI